MKIPDAALRLAATEQERLGWIRHLERIGEEYREQATLAYPELITAPQRQIRSRKQREL